MLTIRPMSEPVIALVALPLEESNVVAKALVESRRAACVSVLPAMTSFYWWNGELQQDPGVMLVIKTIREKLTDVEQCVRENSKEEVPEFLVLDVTGGGADYLKWLETEVSSGA